MSTETTVASDASSLAAASLVDPLRAPHAADPAECEASLAAALRRCAAVIQTTYRSQVARLDSEWRLRTSQLERDNRTLRCDVANLESRIAADSRSARRGGSAVPAGGEESEIARLTAEIAALKQREEKWKFKSASVRKWAEEEIQKYKAKAAEDKKRVDGWKRFLAKNMRPKERRQRGEAGSVDNGDAEFSDPVSTNSPAGSGEYVASVTRASEIRERPCGTEQPDDCRHRSRSVSRKKPRLRCHELVFDERSPTLRKRSTSSITLPKQNAKSGEFCKDAVVSSPGVISGVTVVPYDGDDNGVAQEAHLDQTALIARPVILSHASRYEACDTTPEASPTEESAIVRKRVSPSSGSHTLRSENSVSPRKKYNRGSSCLHPDGAAKRMVVCDESNRGLSCARVGESSSEELALLLDVHRPMQGLGEAASADELPQEHQPNLTSSLLVGPDGGKLETRPLEHGLPASPRAVDERGRRPVVVLGGFEPEAFPVDDSIAWNIPDGFAQPSRYPRSGRRQPSGVGKALRLGDQYKFDEVVRGKHARRHLHGVACAHCMDFYRAAGILGPAVDPQYVDHRYHHNPNARDGDWPAENDDAFFQDRIQKVSRHRHLYLPPDTPPRFWDIGFPTTQEINEAKDRRTAEETRAVSCVANTGSAFCVLARQE